MEIKSRIRDRNILYIGKKWVSGDPGFTGEVVPNPDNEVDEPTTALDVTIQSQILELINKLKEERNLSIIFITHDMGVVANMADEISVMYAGKIVEYGTSEDIFYDPRHPYTWALLSSSHL